MDRTDQIGAKSNRAKGKQIRNKKESKTNRHNLTKSKRKNKIEILIKRTTAAIFVVLTLAITYLPGTPSWDDIYAAVGLCSATQTYELDDLNVFFIDVGQGDSILVYTEGSSILIDTGSEGNEDKIYRLLKDLDIETLDYLIITHQHEDHMGSQKGLERRIRISNEIIPSSTSKMSGMTLELPVNERDKITLNFLGPIFGSDNQNNMSLVIKLVYKNTSFLFTGDAEEEEEMSLVRQCGDALKSDVLKVGHHGSESSSTMTFLNMVQPKFAVISVGAGNDYGHPHESTLESLKRVGAETRRTDRDGTVLCTTNGEKVEFK
ncbi:MAG: MBL fold metallo-hydrolase [Oscillospiraceae bacterium]|nr:MBL fold metallo-hydrolase [Candidatus Limimonas coprohippi]